MNQLFDRRMSMNNGCYRISVNLGQFLRNFFATITLVRGQGLEGFVTSFVVQIGTADENLERLQLIGVLLLTFVLVCGVMDIELHE